MKLIKPSWEIIEQKPGLEGIYEQIELAGRTCYKSTRPAGTTAKDFVDRMIASKHYAMLEHSTVYLQIPYKGDIIRSKYYKNPFSKVNHHSTSFNTGFIDVTTNFRVLVENDWLDDLQYLCEPTEYHEKRVTVRFTTSNGIMREFTRHRAMSFAVESTRYCNYSRNKFNNELVFIEPSWFNKDKCNIDFIQFPSIPSDTFFPEYDYGYLEGEYYKTPVSKEDMFIWSLEISEKAYLESIRLGAKPQEAREVLPLATKCDMVITGFVSDWDHFFDLRARGTTGAPHPDAKALAEPLMNEFIKRKLV